MKIYLTTPMVRDLLHVLAVNDGVARYDAPELSGYAKHSCDRAMIFLRGNGLAVLRSHGEWRATEAGKIVHAILAGQEAKRLARFRRAGAGQSVGL